MTRRPQASLILFAIGMMGFGILVFVYGDFVEEWQTVAAWVPGRTALVYASGVVMLVCGLGVLVGRTRAMAIRILFPFLIIGVLVQLPAIVMKPLVEGYWESAGEVTTLLGAGWVLFATSERGKRIGQRIFGAALLPIGISHFVYLSITVNLVPTYFPFRTGLAYLTGAAHIAAGLGVLFSVRARLAAALEAVMLAIFTILVWVPRVVAGPPSHDLWTEFMTSVAVTAAAWVIADSVTLRPRGREDSVA
jgi:uncharacterized membrane protein